MQNYLLSHVLFDGKEVAKKEKPPTKQEEIEDIDDIENYLDDEYRAKIEQYCALLDDDKPKKKKKKKTTKAKKKEENLPTLKTVDIKAIQQQMQEQMKKPVEKKVEKDSDPVFSKNESHVNKFKGIFDNDAKEEGEAKPLGQNKGREKGGKSDILSKIKALENAEKERLEKENEKKRQEDLDRKRKIEQEIMELQRRKQQEQIQKDEKKRLEAQKELEALTTNEKTPTNQRNNSDGNKISEQQVKETNVRKETTKPGLQPPLIHLEDAHPQLPLKKAGPIQQLSSYERIQKSDSIIELREKELASKSSEQVPKSRSVRDLSKAFLDQSQNIIPQSVAEINRNSFLSTNDPKDNVKEPSPISPKIQRSNNELSVTSPQYDSTSSNGLENDDLEMVHSPVISRYSDSPRVPLSPNSSQGSIVTASQSSVTSESTRPSRSKLNNTDLQKPSARHQSNPRKEMHDKLMNEALLQVEAKKEKAKPKQPVSRMNPTIAAMEIMTRKEIKQGEMEQRLARGELPQIPVPATPVHMKDQLNKAQDKNNSTGMEGVKTVGGHSPFNKLQGRSNSQHPGQGDQILFHV